MVETCASFQRRTSALLYWRAADKPDIDVYTKKLRYFDTDTIRPWVQKGAYQMWLLCLFPFLLLHMLSVPWGPTFFNQPNLSEPFRRFTHYKFGGSRVLTYTVQVTLKLWYIWFERSCMQNKICKTTTAHLLCSFDISFQVLPCLHTFCLSCLSKSTPEHSLTLTCPVCRLQSILPPEGVRIMCRSEVIIAPCRSEYTILLMLECQTSAMNKWNILEKVEKSYYYSYRWSRKIWLFLFVLIKLLVD